MSRAHAHYAATHSNLSSCTDGIALLNASEVFLPEHLRLGPHNWLEFRYAVETVLRTKGIPLAHLAYTACPAFISDHLRFDDGSEHTTDEARRAVRQQWAVDNALCKAIIILNVRSDYVRLVAHDHNEWCAAEVWTALVHHELAMEDLNAWRWRWLWRVYFWLLGMIVVSVYLTMAMHWPC